MTFGHPLLLLSLLVIPLAVGIYLLAERRRMRYAIAFTNLGVLASVAGGRSWRRYVPPVLFLLALGSLCIAVARPHRSTLIPSDRATVILVVDISGSMSSTDVKPSRLEAAQAAVRTFLDHVPPRVRVGLIAFAGEPQVAAPPTTDREVLRASLDQIGFLQGFGGTAIGDALALAVTLAKPVNAGPAQTIANTTPRWLIPNSSACGEGLHQAACLTRPASRPVGLGVGRGGRDAPRAGPQPRVLSIGNQSSRPGSSLATILFLSDGKQTRGTLEPLEGAQRAKDAGIPVYTIALGTPNGTVTGSFGFGQGRTIPVPPDPATLRAVASLTSGKFFAAQSAEAVQSAYKNLGSLVGRVKGRKEVTNEFLAVAAVLLLGAGVLSAAWSPRLP